MNNQELLQRIELTHEWTSKAILELRELTQRENKYTQESINELKTEILENIQLTISKMEILSFELEG